MSTDNLYDDELVNDITPNVFAVLGEKSSLSVWMIVLPHRRFAETLTVPKII